MSKVEKYVQKRTTTFEFNGPHGAVSGILGMPFTVVAMAMLCTEEGCPPDLFSFDVMERIRSTAWFDYDSLLAVLGWMAFHFVMAVLAPGRTVLGSTLPDGSKLSYKLNGFSTFVTCISLFLLTTFRHGLGMLLWIADHYFTIATAAMMISFTMSLFLFAYSYRSNQVILAEGGNSGYPHYDFWIGRELNPRILGLDLKFICELRPGLFGWIVLNSALVAKQYVDHGQVSNSMVLVYLGQFYYVFDAIWNENAILTTMDIVSDGFGFMLVFGDLAWVPFIYTLQTKYLSLFPVHLSITNVAMVVALNLFGLYVFRASNGEKDRFRRNSDDPSCAHLKYMKTERGSKLLTSGWWGMARKINYTGDWLMALAWCFACGFGSPVPYFFSVYFASLLIHRAGRDDELCEKKYGRDWQKYKKLVPYKFIPGLF